MNLTKENIIAIKSTLIEAGYMPQLAEGVTPSGDWTVETQQGFDRYLVTHEDVFAYQMVGKQPGNMEQLGASLGHAIDHGITLFEAAAKKLSHWFVAKKDDAQVKASKLVAEAKTKEEALLAEAAQKLANTEAAAKIETERLAELARVKLEAAKAEAERLAVAAAHAIEAAKDNVPAPRGNPVVTAPSTEAQASGAVVPPTPVVETATATAVADSLKVERK